MPSRIRWNVERCGSEVRRFYGAIHPGSWQFRPRRVRLSVGSTSIFMSLRSGTRLGPYEILSALGAGGMGEVYRARDSRLQRTVAIKILPAHVSGHPDAKARF